MCIQAVLFDAVGTLIYPDPPAGQVYYELGRRFGSSLSLSQVESRFRTALSAAAWAGRTDRGRERSRWRAIVAATFGNEVTDSDMLFEQLWSHFGWARHWRLYDDVEEVWQWLDQRPVRIGIASNFDERLLDIVGRIPVLQKAAHVFCSSEIGHSKPSREFFATVQSALGLRGRQIVLIGDHADHDVAAARAAGWQAIHLIRGADADSCPAGAVSTLTAVRHQLGMPE